MATIYTFTSDAAPGDEPVIVQTYCNVVTIQEKDINGTVNLLVREPALTSAQAVFPPGYRYEFRGGGYSPGTIIGYVSVGSGAVTIQQIESR